ncbi:unnamed protein product [Periconia digitata]|uniref:Uncharacterized protein n=1 Tax=Periconia digitata TaxID=1303443 RepID=A0A9W4XED6_9PLEO|nr:unnamed protein product [Periconia digitata]
MSSTVSPSHFCEDEYSWNSVLHFPQLELLSVEYKLSNKYSNA